MEEAFAHRWPGAARHWRFAQAGKGRGEADGVIAPAALGQELGQERHDHAGNFGEKEVRHVQADTASERDEAVRSPRSPADPGHKAPVLKGHERD